VAALFNVVLPVALIVAIGVIAGLKLPLDIASLTRITLYVFAPALAADSMYRAQVGAGAAIRIFIAYSGATLALYLLVRIISRTTRQTPEAAKSLISTTIFPNVGNFGLSLTVLALGTQALDRAFVTFSAGAFFVFGLGPALISGGGVRAGIRTTIRLPMMWALLAGILLRVLGIQLPSGIADGLHLLAGAAIPTLLVTLGLQISRQKLEVQPSDWLATGLRLGAGPLAAWLAGRAVGLDPLALKVLVLQCATPTAVNALLISAEFGGDARKAARVVVLSSFVCLITIPIVMALMGIDS
jgi:predicted permease